MIKLRNAFKDELPAIAALCREAYEDMSFGLKPEDRERQLQLAGDAYERFGRGIVIAAFDDDELAGTVTYYAPGKHGHPRMEYVWAALRILAVSPDHQQRGIGRLLVEECVRRAQYDQAGDIALQTSELTPIAVAMYEGMGFRRVKEFEQYGRKYWIYVLRLQSYWSVGF